jgi:hypothetical protein
LGKLPIIAKASGILSAQISLFKKSNEYFESCADINRAEDFLRYFSIAGWEKAKKDSEKRIILFFDEFDRIYEMDNDLRSNFLSTLHDIKNTIESYVIQAIIVIGTFSILHLDSDTNLTSPFNIKDSIRNPNFNLEQVQGLFSEFGDGNKIDFEKEVIEDIFKQSNGYVKIAGPKYKTNNFLPTNNYDLLIIL